MKMNRIDPKIILIPLVISCFFLACQQGRNEKEKAPVAIDGFLDLEGFPLQKKEIHLQGQWKFVPGRFLKYEEINDFLNAQKVTVPHSWKNPWGYGTYFLRIFLGNHHKQEILALGTSDSGMAQRIFIDGKEMAVSGNPADTAEEHQPGERVFPFYFVPEKNTFTIYIHTSNFCHVKTGLTADYSIGPPDIINSDEERHRGMEFFIFGAIFIMGIINLLFFLKHRNLAYAFYFSVLCFSFIVRALTYGATQIVLLFPQMPTEVSTRLEFISLVFIVSAFMFFIQELFRKSSWRLITLLLLIPSFIYLLMAVFAPIKMVSSFVLPYQIYMIILIIYVMVILIRAIHRGRRSAVVILSGFIGLSAASVYDILYFNHVFYYGPIAASWGIFFFLIFQGLFLATKFAFSMHRYETLSKEYQKANEYLIESKTEIQKQQERLNFMALYDSLTGLPNRISLNRELEKEIIRAERLGEKLAVIYLDIDAFKIINDSMGHNAGDAIIIQAAERLNRGLRRTDTIYRLNSDEFIIIAEEMKNKMQTTYLMEKIHDFFHKAFYINGAEIFLTASCGVAVFPDDGHKAEELIKNADIAMGKAKKNGKGLSAFYNIEMDSEARNRFRLENDLRRAIDKNQMALAYQLQINAENKKITGVEALIRWVKPNGEIIMPSGFISQAEESGIIHKMGEWTLQEAIRQFRQWKKNGTKIPSISVNISAQQFENRHFIPRLEKLYQESELSKGELDIEITESMLMNNPKAASDKMHKIKEMGIRISIDDFGTGYSSLAYLRDFPADVLKIDKSFVRNCHKDPYNTSIVKSIISIAGNLGIELIAEGVEETAEMEFLRQNGCKIMQGFLYARPLFSSDLENTIKEDNNIFHTES